MKVKVFADFREICGQKEIHVDIHESTPVIQILDHVVDQYPPMADELFTIDKELKPLIHVFVNGKNIVHAHGLQTVVRPSDQIALFPPVAGG